MARSVFPSTNDSYVLSVGGFPQAGIPVRIWSRQVGGSQVTDLTFVGYDGSIGAAVPSGVLYSDSNGLLPTFAGPDGGATILWGDHGMSGERIALSSEPVAGGGGGGSVFSVVGQTGTVTGGQILADSTVSTALSAKAPLASPTFTGTPTVPTATAGTNTTQAASTAFVATAVASGGGGAVSSVVGQTGAVTGAQILADSAVSTALGLKAPLASPALTGTPTVPTASPGTTTTQAASTAFTVAAVTAETTRATTAEGLAAQKSANLSDLTSAPTARTSLGLGAAATMSTAQIAADAALTGTFAAKLNATTKTGAYTAAAGDFVLADAAGAAFTVTLPPSPTLGQQVAVKKVDATANAVTVSAAGKTIDGDASAVITAQWAGAIFSYDGTNWVIAAPTYAGGVSFGTSAGTAAQGNDSRITGAAQKSANLTDLADPAAARTALNLQRLFTPMEQLAASPDLMVVGAITRSVTGAATGFNVVWPDGATGAFVGTESLTASGAIDSYTVTRVVSGQPTKTFTQSTLTRDGAGAVTNRPAMTVS